MKINQLLENQLLPHCIQKMYNYHNLQYPRLKMYQGYVCTSEIFKQNDRAQA